MKFLNQLKLFALLPLAAALAGPAHAESAVEVVQSVPVETTLAVPGIRSTQEVWIEMIKGAKQSIDLEQFYIYQKDGEALDPVLAALRQAAARGVKVRLIVDSKFFKTYPGIPTELAGLKNVQAKVIDFSPGVQHAKYIVVDGVNSFIGSANFDWLALTHIHEVGLRLTDKDVGQNLEAVFGVDWNSAEAIGAGAKVASLAKPASEITVQDGDITFLASPRAKNPSGLSDTLSELARQIESARKSVRVQVYQYSVKGSGRNKWLVLDSVLRRAAERGVKVQLLVDAVALKNSSPELKALAAVANVEVKAVTIPEWSGGHLDYARLVHSKYLTIDGLTAWVGTENWSQGYFDQSRNVGVIVNSPEVAGQLNQIFSQVWNSSYATSL